MKKKNYHFPTDEFNYETYRRYEIPRQKQSIDRILWKTKKNPFALFRKMFRSLLLDSFEEYSDFAIPQRRVLLERLALRRPEWTDQCIVELRRDLLGLSLADGDVSPFDADPWIFDDDDYLAHYWRQKEIIDDYSFDV